MTASTLPGLTVYLSRLNFGKWYLSSKLSISFRFFSLVEYRFLKYVLTILLILLASVVVPLFVSNFVNIDIFLHILVNLDKDFSILFTFSKKQLLASLIFISFSLFLFYWFQSSVWLFLPSWMCILLFILELWGMLLSC